MLPGGFAGNPFTALEVGLGRIDGMDSFRMRYALSRPDVRSFVAQRLNGVDARCAPGREPGGRRGGQAQHQGECRESGRIE